VDDVRISQGNTVDPEWAKLREEANAHLARFYKPEMQLGLMSVSAEMATFALSLRRKTSPQQLRELTPRMRQAIEVYEREMDGLRLRNLKGTAKILEEEFAAVLTEWQLSEPTQAELLRRLDAPNAEPLETRGPTPHEPTEIEFLESIADYLREPAIYPYPLAARAGSAAELVRIRLKRLKLGRLDAPAGRFGIYMVSKTKHAAKWKGLRTSGVPIISTWIDEAGIGETKSFSDLWLRCISETGKAERVIVYAEEGDELKGGLVEVGAALANGTPVFIVGRVEPLKTARNHPLVTEVETLEEALAALASPRPASPPNGSDNEL